ncbi:hypothetical protein CIPAW_11G203600 [Carya illinoinensis]|uniref:Uncharacterized protein n=1 Tax=Carya illinoinensis TaxID=32201 RepID=A0A8T1P7W3_CARIL|nr:hypothetical protein CIPAW_11G203600 [Carya illinoinensis]
MTPAPLFESAPDSSLTGPCAEVSGDNLDGTGLGGLLLDGKTAGDSTGVAELDGIFADASGVGPFAGTSAVFGAPTGVVSGGLMGVELGGDKTCAGDGTGEDALGEGLVVGETTAFGGLEGDFPGEIDGDFAGGFDTGAGVSGVGVGDKVGDFEGDGGLVAGETAEEVLGEIAGEMDGEGDFVGGVDVVGFGEGAGALSACTTPERDTHRTNI